MQMLDAMRRFRTRSPWRRTTGVLLCAALATAAACGDDDDPTGPQSALFRVQACEDETFTVRITSPDVIAEAASLVGAEDQPVLLGDLARGDGGFNDPWSWHLVPGTISFADAATEVCDGCPSFVEEELDYWVDDVGRYCPFTSEVLERVD